MVVFLRAFPCVDRLAPWKKPPDVREVGAIFEAPGHLSGALLSSILEKKASGAACGFTIRWSKVLENETRSGMAIGSRVSATRMAPYFFCLAILG